MKTIYVIIMMIIIVSFATIIATRAQWGTKELEWINKLMANDPCGDDDDDDDDDDEDKSINWDNNDDDDDTNNNNGPSEDDDDANIHSVWCDTNLGLWTHLTYYGHGFLGFKVMKLNKGQG